jgi:hypothetical protein
MCGISVPDSGYSKVADRPYLGSGSTVNGRVYARPSAVNFTVYTPGGIHSPCTPGVSW